jgi:hypothetical protein
MTNPTGTYVHGHYIIPRRLDDTDRNILADLRGEGECDHDERTWTEFPGEPRRYVCADCGEDLTDSLRD